MIRKNATLRANPIFGVGDILTRKVVISADPAFWNIKIVAVNTAAQTYSTYYTRLPITDQEIKTMTFDSVQSLYKQTGSTLLAGIDSKWLLIGAGALLLVSGVGKKLFGGKK